ncbi:hypothetical protein NHF50_03410 [Flavobacterium sp. NRK F10]|uniref:hypothetical protein n=1 Tax=Flavobacterium sp. NRK F10 TaxID=2954931 RepID=UPI0020918207|nr:hypothetical protein [Flavobacterium sp. NRK F10]MCO6174084.1 hypothetical protein [Flavobacterium sp. NRK F10]
MILSEFFGILNSLDFDLLSHFPYVEGKLGEELAKKIIQKREEQLFTSEEMVLDFFGIEEESWQLWKDRLDINEKSENYLKSHNLFIFKGEPSIPEEYSETIYFKEVAFKEELIITDSGEIVKPVSDVKKYELFYSKELDKQALVESLESQENFIDTVEDEIFAIQLRNNFFIVVAGAAYSRNIRLANTCRVVYEVNNAHYLGNTNQQNWPCLNKSVVFETRYFNSPPDFLSFDSALNRVKAASNNQQITINELFDVNGIFSPPNWAGQGVYKHFNMMNWVQSQLLQSDPRQFIKGKPDFNSNRVLLGSGNNQEFWNPDYEFRFVQILDDVLIEVKSNQTTGSQRRFLSLQNGNLTTVDKLISQVQIEDQFRIHVIHGLWKDRRSVTTKIIIENYYYQKFVVLSENQLNIKEELSTFEYTPQTEPLPIHPDMLFDVEDGWGGTIDDIVLKSNEGKYLSNWNNLMIADKNAPLPECQLRIIRP